jgi:hypothetical protein
MSELTKQLAERRQLYGDAIGDWNYIRSLELQLIFLCKPAVLRSDDIII